MLSLNNNLLHSIVSYMPVQGKAALSATDRTLMCLLDSSFNDQWREECNKHFYSPKNDGKTIDCASYAKELDIRSFPWEMNWKRHFKGMIGNRKAFSSFSSRRFPQFTQQFQSFEGDLFNALKNDSFLPHLRRPNEIIESSFNSPHQTFFFDFKQEEDYLYHQYDSYFLQGNQQAGLKHSSLPLSGFIETFELLLTDLNQSQNDKALLLQAINYNFGSFDAYGQTSDSTNPLIYFIIHFYRYIRDYCIFTLNYLLKYSQASFSRNRIPNQQEVTSELFWNEFIQRYDSFVSGALLLNEQLENFAVCVNYLNAFLSQSNRLKKFNVYKMIYSIWYEEVTVPLARRGLLDLHLQSFLRNFFKEELNADRIEEGKADLGFTDLMLPSCPEDNEFTLSRKSLIESMANCFLDTNCNEDTVASINHSQASLFQLYDSFELTFTSIAYDVLSDRIRKGELTKHQVLDYMRNEAGMNGFSLIMKTKKTFLKAIALSLKEHLSTQLLAAHSSFLSANIQNRMTTFNYPLREDKAISYSVSLEIEDIKRHLTSFGMSKHSFSLDASQSYATAFLNSNHSLMHFLRELYTAYYSQLHHYESNDESIAQAIETDLNRSVQPTKKDAQFLLEDEEHSINEIILN